MIIQGKLLLLLLLLGAPIGGLYSFLLLLRYPTRLLSFAFSTFSVSYGPPICLDWEYFQLPELDLDLYESHRGKRRGMRQMMMNYYQRRNLLSWRYGITEEQLKQAERDANKIKRSRSFTKALLPAQKLEEMVQSVSRKTKRMANKNKREVEEVSA